jgi:hypothetical protein
MEAYDVQFRREVLAAGDSGDRFACKFRHRCKP